MNIILVGFMGSGKTTIGKKLSKMLEYNFVDTDNEIEENQGCSIDEIFKYAGEKCFRDMETDLLNNLKKIENTVIATGGGMILRDCNQKILQEIGKQVYLKVPKEILLKRLKFDQNRPLLKVKNPEFALKKMYEERCLLYEQAECIIETGGISPKHTALKIMQKIRDEGKERNF